MLIRIHLRLLCVKKTIYYINIEKLNLIAVHEKLK